MRIHATKLEKSEEITPLTDSFLDIDSRSWRVKFYHDENNKHDGQEDNDSYAGEKHVK